MFKSIIQFFFISLNKRFLFKYNYLTTNYIMPNTKYTTLEELRAAQQATNNRYREKNKEKIAQRRKELYEENIEENRQKKKEYYAKNKDKKTEKTGCGICEKYYANSWGYKKHLKSATHLTAAGLDVVREFSCKVCDVDFLDKRTLDNHSNSQKHKENVSINNEIDNLKAKIKELRGVSNEKITKNVLIDA